MASDPARLALFHDDCDAIGPLTDLRPSFEVRTGALTTAERAAAVFGRGLDGVWAPPSRRALASEVSSVRRLDEAEIGDAVLVNGRCPVPDPAWLDLAPGQAVVDPDGGGVVAARLATGDVGAFLMEGALPEDVDVETLETPRLIAQPWDVVRFRDEALAFDLRRIEDGDRSDWRFEAVGEHPIRVHPTATVARSATPDSTAGPVVIEEGAQVRHGAVVLGPCVVGASSVVLEGALLKGNAAIGPVCKVAGELSGVIVQGYSNKAHDGHLGDAWLGRWVNLGAGTVNSNLLNTYTEVTAQASPGARRVRTGMTFLGCVLGIT